MSLINRLMWVRLLSVLLVVVGLVGCNDSKQQITLSGVVQKGAFTQLKVEAFLINDGAGVLGSPVGASYSNNSQFQLTLTKGHYYQLQASGVFINEITGELVELTQPLLSVIKVENSDLTSNINLLTHLSSLQAGSRQANGSPISIALPESVNFVQQVLNFPSLTDFTQLDWRQLTSSSQLNDPDLQLLLFSAAVMLEASPVAIEPEQNNLQKQVLLSDKTFAFGGFISQFANFSTPEQASEEMTLLDGVGAAALFELIKPNVVGLPDSIPAVETSQALFVCAAPAPCSWQIFAARAISLSWRPAQKGASRNGRNLVSESFGQVDFLIRMTSSSATDTQVTLSSSPISSQAGVDYRSASKVITIPAGSTQVMVSMPIFIDNLDEPIEEIRYQLEKLNDSYLLGIATRVISVSSDYGPVGESLNQQVNLASLCLSAIGDGGTINRSGCLQDQLLALPDSSRAAVGFDLALQVSCDLSEPSCAPQDRDWQVELSFELFDKDSNVTAQTLLGNFRFKGKALAANNDPSVIQTVYAHVDEEFARLIKLSKTLNVAARIKARLSETDQVGLAENWSDPLQLPAQIIANGQLLDYQLLNIVQTSQCNGTSYLITANFSLDNENFSESTVCVDMGDSSTTQPGVLLSGRINIDNNRLWLPDFHSSHVVYGQNRIQSQGADYLIIPNSNNVDSNGSTNAANQLCDVLNCYRGQDLLPEKNIEALTIYLQAEGLPYSMAISGGYVDASGVNLTFSQTKYAHAGEYSVDDPRQTGRVKSNDIFFSGTGGFAGINSAVEISGQLLLSAQGIATEFNLPANSGRSYAYPLAVLSWPEFQVTIENSRMEPLEQLNVTFDMPQTSLCPSCVTGTINTHRLIGSLLVDDRGVSLGKMMQQENQPFVSSWGKVEFQRAFRREGDLAGFDTNGQAKTAMVSLPGYRFENLDEQGLDSYLQGNVERQAVVGNSDNLFINSLLSGTAMDGNQWPVGITLGPQLYFDDSSDGSPFVGTGRDISDVPLIINNGVDVERPLTLNIGAKYVVRNSGISGVFNADIDSAIPESMPFYGYDMRFDRFAFRLTDNQHDSFSWIDGKIYIPGIGDFSTQFGALNLACDAKFSGANVTQCEGQNCTQQRLLAWKADTDIFNMSFVGEGGDAVQACRAESQSLSLEQTIKMLAVDKEIGLRDVIWASDGSIGTSKMARLQSMQLDRKQTDPANNFDGFSLRANQARLRVINNGNGLNDYGVVELSDATMAVSRFWDALKTDVRLANLTTTAGDKSVVTGSQKLPPLDDVNNKDFNLSNTALADSLVKDAETHRYSPYVKYQWGDSKFSFELPVYYDSGSLSSSASFYGRYREKDLLIMQAGAGVDFITPDQTALSFGASANIPELSSLPLRVDISRLDSLVNVDGLLSDLGVGFSFENTFADLQVNLSSILRLSNDGLNRAIKTALDDILVQTGDRASVNGVSLWQETVEPMASIVSLPSQLQVLLSDELSTRYRTEVFDTSLSYRSLFQTLQTTLDNLDSTLLVDLSVNERSTLLSAIDQIELYFSSTARLNVELAINLQTLTEQSLGLIDQAAGSPEFADNNQLTRLENSLQTLSGILNQSVNLDAFCQSGGGVADTSHFLTPLTRLTDSIDSVTATFKEFSVIADSLSPLLGGNPEMQAQLNRMTSQIQQRSEAVDTEWSNAKGELLSLICVGGFNDPGSYLVEVDNMLSALTSEIAQFRLALANARQIIATNLASTQYQLSLQAQQTLIFEAAFSQAKISLESPSLSITIADLHTDILQGLSSTVVNTLYASSENDNQVDYHFGYVVPVQTLLMKIPQVVQEAVPRVNFPGAFFSADDFRRLIRNKIMDSLPMGELVIAADLRLKTSITELTGIEITVADFTNQAVKGLLSQVASPLNELLADAAAELPSIPVGAAEIDGNAVIAGSSLERIHLQAGWESFSQDPSVKGNAFNGSFDARRYMVDSSAESSCGLLGGVTLFDTSVYASSPIRIGGSSSANAEIELGFTFDESNDAVSAYLPISFNGRFAIEGDIERDPFILRDVNFGVGIGRSEAYVSAGGAGSFDSTELSINAFVGKTCDASLISKMDEQAASLLNFQQGVPFTGIYGRGAATIPVLGGSCMLDVAVRASIGSWLTIDPVPSIGGYIGGGAQGSLACIGSVRGDLNTVAQADINGDIYFAGEAFVVAGAGYCERSRWTSVKRSRRDSWCGTADMSVNVEYKNEEWSYDPKNPSAIH